MCATSETHKLNLISLLLVFFALGGCGAKDLQEEFIIWKAQQKQRAAASTVSLSAVRSLKCQFPRGIFIKWNGGTISPESDGEGLPEIFFDNINFATGKARIIGNNGASDVSLIRQSAGLSFVETTTFGSVIITTIFTHSTPDGEYLAVMSRHIDSLASPLPSQYYGMCRAW